MKAILRALRRPIPEGATMMMDLSYDRVLMGAVLALIGFGIVMVYSASAVAAQQRFGAEAFFFKRQLAFLGIAIVALMVGTRVHHELIRRLAFPLLGVAVFTLLLTYVPGLSAEAKGAARWLDLGVVRFQPSELVKLSFIVFMARYLSDRGGDVGRWAVGWGRPLIVFAVLGALLMGQPDFGTTIMCGGVMFLLIWVAGGRHLHALALIGLAVPALALAVWMEPYRIRRITAFLRPDEDPLGSAYHINQALISLGSGEVSGLGLGLSRQKLLYLPDAHTDFILSIIGEELGFLGVCIIVLLFGTVTWRGLRAVRYAATPFAGLLAFGLTAQICFQATVNMGVVTALLPTKGLTLPFISYGGSSLVITAFSVGVLLGISSGELPGALVHRVIGWFPEESDTRVQKRRRIRSRAA